MAIYLDYNATSPIDLRVLDYMIEIYKDKVGNADSRTHFHGEEARKVVEEARKKVANLLAITPDEVFFTSGATESNNIALQGLKDYAETTQKKHIITTTIEHKAVFETAKALQKRGFEVDFIKPDISGRVDALEVLSKIRPDTLVVSIMHVNNETGVIQPVKEIGEALQDTGVLFHVDATQSCGKLITELQTLHYNMLSFSAHKLRGPQGVGCIILRKKKYIFPPVKAIMYGGQQEHGIRPGTVPVALVAGCGKACELALQDNRKNQQAVARIRDGLIQALSESGVKYAINGDISHCVSNTLNVCFEGVSAEALMIATKQYCSISNGSACTSKDYSPSYVLTAMGLPVDRIESSVRISWGPEINYEDFVSEISKMIDAVKGFQM